MTFRTSIAVLVASAGLAGTPSFLLAQHDQGHGHAEVKAAETFDDAVARIRLEVAELQQLLAAKSVVAAHEPANAISQLAGQLGRLALKPGSGVAREKIRDANIAGKDLAKVASQMHDAADKNDAAACAALLPRLNALVAAVGVFAPEKWVCDMHCEPGTSFDGPGTCPVCKMAYKPISQVPYSASIVASPNPVMPGTKTDLTVRLIDPAGNPVKNLAIVHEKPLHLLMVSSDLSWYAHEHPTPRPDGTLTLPDFAFPAPGEYTLFFDFTPEDKPQQVPQYKVKVQGEAKALVPLVEDYDVVGKVDGYEFRVRCNGEKFMASADSIIRIGIDRDGKPITDLENYLGALGHLVIISQDLKQFVHSHPMDMDDAPGHGDEADGHAHEGAHAGHDHDAILNLARASESLANGKPADVVFHAVFPKPGLYKGFAQFQHQGKILTFPFVIDAQPGDASPHDNAAPAGQGHDHLQSGEKK